MFDSTKLFHLKYKHSKIVNPSDYKWSYLLISTFNSLFREATVWSYWVKEQQ